LFLNKHTLPLVACSSVTNNPRRLSHCFGVNADFIHSEFLDFKLKELDWIACVVVLPLMGKESRRREEKKLILLLPGCGTKILAIKSFDLKSRNYAINKVRINKPAVK
jgi:hypothetical protein